jgi:spermidine/putrescine-binding protein
MDEALIMEMWDIFREYIPEKNKDMAANQYVDYLLGKDITPAVLETFMGYDPHLDDAIKTVVDENASEDGDEYDEDNFGYEDEDY